MKFSISNLYINLYNKTNKKNIYNEVTFYFCGLNVYMPFQSVKYTEYVSTCWLKVSCLNKIFQVAALSWQREIGITCIAQVNIWSPAYVTQDVSLLGICGKFPLSVHTPLICSSWLYSNKRNLSIHFLHHHIFNEIQISLVTAEIFVFLLSTRGRPIIGLADYRRRY